MLVNAPYGLKPIYHPSGQLRPRVLDGGIASGYSSSIFLGDPVSINPNSGNIIVGTGSAAIVGSFAGCEYTDTFGRTHEVPAWIASTATQSGSNIRAWFHEDPETLYVIQAAGSLAQTSVGNQANITVGTGSSITNVSAAVISTTLVGSGSAAVLSILNLYPDINNAWGDAFTAVIVRIAKHQFRAAYNAI